METAAKAIAMFFLYFCIYPLSPLGKRQHGKSKAFPVRFGLFYLVQQSASCLANMGPFFARTRFIFFPCGVIISPAPTDSPSRPPAAMPFMVDTRIILPSLRKSAHCQDRKGRSVPRIRMMDGCIHRPRFGAFVLMEDNSGPFLQRLC